MGSATHTFKVYGTGEFTPPGIESWALSNKDLLEIY